MAQQQPEHQRKGAALDAGALRQPADLAPAAADPGAADAGGGVARRDGAADAAPAPPLRDLNEGGSATKEKKEGFRWTAGEPTL